MIDERALKRIVGAVIVSFLVMYSTLLLPAKWVDLLAGREMVYEMLGSLFFLAASICFYLAFRAVSVETSSTESTMRKVRSGPPARWRRLAYGLLTLLLFVACGEELSWGQHLLGFETPESIKELNVQQEMNLHNLWLVDSFGTDGEKKIGWQALVNSNRLFDYFMIILLWILPIAHTYQPILRNWIDRFGGPVVPLKLGLPLVVSFGLTIVTEAFVVDGMRLHLAVSETRELSYAVLCALAAWFLWQKERS